MSYIDDFLEEYQSYMDEDYNTIRHLLFLLPPSYVYIFTLNLLKYRDDLYAGNTITGDKRIGYIYYTNKKIILDIDDTIITLLTLPEPYEL